MRGRSRVARAPHERANSKATWQAVMRRHDFKSVLRHVSSVRQAGRDATAAVGAARGCGGERLGAQRLSEAAAAEAWVWAQMRRSIIQHHVARPGQPWAAPNARLKPRFQLCARQSTAKPAAQRSWRCGVGTAPQNGADSGQPSRDDGGAAGVVMMCIHGRSARRHAAPAPCALQPVHPPHLPCCWRMRARQRTASAPLRRKERG